jgi:hypothetical protein
MSGCRWRAVFGRPWHVGRALLGPGKTGPNLAWAGFVSLRTPLAQPVTLRPGSFRSSVGVVIAR